MLPSDTARIPLLLALHESSLSEAWTAEFSLWTIVESKQNPFSTRNKEKLALWAVFRRFRRMGQAHVKACLPNTVKNI